MAPYALKFFFYRHSKAAIIPYIFSDKASTVHRRENHPAFGESITAVGLPIMQSTDTIEKGRKSPVDFYGLFIDFNGCMPEFRMRLSQRERLESERRAALPL
jgi:hypothetical protein